MRCNAPAYEGTKPYIFISYCHDDEARVYPYIEMLARNGCRVWYDEGITPGEEWPEVIARHLEGSAVFLAIITESSVNSHNCRREINYAISLNKEMLCLFIDDVQLSSAMSMLLANTQAVKRSRFELAEECVDSLMQNESVGLCCGEIRQDIAVLERIDDNEMTLTMTHADTILGNLNLENILLRINTMEEIPIDKSIFTVGRSEGHSDYAMKGEPSISRRHMTIKRVGSKFYVIDNESLNHVILNGRMITPGQEYELESYDVLLLAHEAIVFIKNYSPRLAYENAYVLRAGQEQYEFEIKTAIRIGSKRPDHTGRGCEVCIPDAEPEHCFMINTPEGLFLVSTSYPARTTVNGRALAFGQKEQLRSGDIIGIGNKQLELIRSI